MAVIAMAGLPATGKSTIARALGERLRAPVLDKDAIRAAVFTPRFVMYTASQDDWCMRVAYQAAEHLFVDMRESHVILDGRTFRRTEQVDELVGVAQRLGQRLCVLECVCSVASARERIAVQRTLQSHPAANRTFEHYRTLAAQMQEIRVEKLVLDTDSGSVEALVSLAMEYLARAGVKR